MSCNDCIDQVLELIEREAVDPAGVREILAECPDCRRLFDELKATLASAERLPIEEPPAAVDAAIMRAAAARVSRGGAPSRHWLKAPPWAAAAVALLAIGIGLWAVPTARQAEHEGEAPATLVQAEIEPVAQPEASPAREEPKPLKAAGERKGTAHLTDERTRARRTGPAAAKPIALSGDEALAAKERAPASGAADDTMAELAAASAAPVPEAPAPATTSLSRQCQRRIARFEEHGPDAGDRDLSPEDALALGRCYQDAGDRQRARAWLTRAAADPKTRSRAERALRELASD